MGFRSVKGAGTRHPLAKPIFYQESQIMKTAVIVLPVLILLSACSSKLEITQPPIAYKTVKPLPTQTYRGDAETTVRTRVETSEGKREVSGASCTLTNGYIESRFQTPARVLTPNLGPATPTGTLRCETADRAAQANLPAVNISLAERSSNARSSGAGGGIIGAIAGGIIAGINEGRGDRPTDVHGYLPTTLQLEAAAAPAGNQ